MMNVMMSQIASYCGSQLKGKDACIVSIVTDSRLIVKGSLFVAMKGEKVDGHDFVKQAIENGAVGVLVERAVDDAIAQIQVTSAQSAMAEIAKHYRQAYEGKIISITGSAGKTSTKEMLVSILKCVGDVVATKGNQNNEIGVPLTVFNLDSSAKFAVIEMGAAQSGDIAYLMDIVSPDVTVITNVGSAHVGRFGSVDIIAKTKGEIYRCLKAGGKAVVNIDDKYSSQWLDDLQHHDVIKISVDNNSADLWISDLLLSHDHSEFRISIKGNVRSVILKVPGLHNVYNALCAAGCALQVGVSVDTIIQGLQQFSSVSSRLQMLKGAWGGVLIDDCYNANPGSVRAAIDVLAVYPSTKYLVLGDMAELGDISKTAHTEMGRYAKQKGIDVLLSCGVDSENASAQFGSFGKHFSTKAALSEYLLKHVKLNDVVLVKGSRSAALEDVIKVIQAKVAN